MASKRNQVCILSRDEYLNQKQFNQEPDCRNHHHRPLSYVEERQRHGEMSLLSRHGRNQAVYSSGVDWRKVICRSPQGNIATMQLVRTGGPVKFGRKRRQNSGERSGPITKIPVEVAR